MKHYLRDRVALMELGDVYMPTYPPEGNNIPVRCVLTAFSRSE